MIITAMLALEDIQGICIKCNDVTLSNVAMLRVVATILLSW